MNKCLQRTTFWNRAMKKEKLFLLVLIAVCICILLSACNNDSSENSSSISGSIVSENATMGSVSEKQLKEDLIAREEVQNCYHSQFVDKSVYILEDYQLVKEQINKENKEDIIYCDIVVSNGCFKVKLSAKALYNFYDRGGWIMDEFSYEVKEIVPIRAPDMEKVISHILEEEMDLLYCYKEKYNYVDGGELRAVSSSFNEETSCARINISVATSAIRMEGYCKLAFTDEEWVFEDKRNDYTLIVTVENFAVDFCNMIGTFSFSSRSGLPAGQIIIHNITEDTIVYSLFFEEEIPAEWGSIRQGENLNVQFDPFTCEAVVGELYAYSGGSRIIVDLTLEYDIADGEWSGSWVGALTPC